MTFHYPCTSALYKIKIGLTTNFQSTGIIFQVIQLGHRFDFKLDRCLGIIHTHTENR